MNCATYTFMSSIYQVGLPYWSFKLLYFIWKFILNDDVITLSYLLCLGCKTLNDTVSTTVSNCSVTKC